MFSVLLPVYNGEKWIADAITSVMNQTYKDFECLVICNGCTDTSYQVALDTVGSDSRFFVHSLDVANKANALNFGVYQSKNDWIAPIDADDTWAPLKLQKQLDFITENPDVDILSCQMTYVGTLNCEAPRNPLDNETIHWCFARGKNPISFPASAYKKNVHFRGVGLYNTSNLVIEDYDFWQRCKQRGMVMANLPDNLAVHRIHGKELNRVSTSVDEEGKEGWSFHGVSKTEYRQQLVKLLVDSWYIDWDVKEHGPYPAYWGVMSNIREFDDVYDLGPGTPVNSTDLEKENKDV